MSVNTQKRTLRLAQMGLLTALIIILCVPPLGAVKVTLFTITLVFLPVSVGAIRLGPLAGAILGTIWGIGSFIQALNNVDGGMFFIQASLWRTLVFLIVPRLLAGLLTAWLFRALKPLLKSPSPILGKLPYVISAVATPLLNSILFLGSLALLFNDTFVTNFLPILGSIIAINSLLEAILGLTIGSAVVIALSRALKRYD